MPQTYKILSFFYRDGKTESARRVRPIRAYYGCGMFPEAPDEPHWWLIAHDLDAGTDVHLVMADMIQTKEEWYEHAHLEAPVRNPEGPMRITE